MSCYRDITTESRDLDNPILLGWWIIMCRIESFPSLEEPHLASPDKSFEVAYVESCARPLKPKTPCNSKFELAPDN